MRVPRVERWWRCGCVPCGGIDALVDKWCPICILEATGVGGAIPRLITPPCSRPKATCRLGARFCATEGAPDGGGWNDDR